MSSSHSRASHLLDFPRSAGEEVKARCSAACSGRGAEAFIGQWLVTHDMVVCYLPRVFRNVHTLLSTENMVEVDHALSGELKERF